MDAQIPEALNIQTFMIVWDIHFKFAKQFDILTPPFTLDPNKSENTLQYNWIRLVTFSDKLQIESNFSSIKKLKGCTTYMINPLTCTLLDVFKGFKTFTWNPYEWSEKMRFVFEVEMQCDTTVVQPTIWKLCTTETRPAINTNAIPLNLDAETSNHTFVNSSRVACLVKNLLILKDHALVIKPEKSSENWNLLTVMLRKLKDNAWESNYLHTTSSKDCDWVGRTYKTFHPIIITEVHELKTSFANISNFEMAAIIKVIKTNLTSSQLKILIETSAITSEKELNPTADDKQELKYRLKLSSNLNEYFNASKFCDVSIHVKDHQIRAHKIVLSTGSVIWNDLFNENEKLETIHIADFDYETIKDLIEYIYTGKVKQATDQLLIAAHKYGVSDLKELCEEKLIETIDMETVVKLLVLADRYKAGALYDKVVDFIVENCKAVPQLEEVKGMFMMHPELSFKLFARLLQK